MFLKAVVQTDPQHHKMALVGHHHLYRAVLTDHQFRETDRHLNLVPTGPLFRVALTGLHLKPALTDLHLRLVLTDHSRKAVLIDHHFKQVPTGRHLKVTLTDHHHHPKVLSEDLLYKAHWADPPRATLTGLLHPRATPTGLLHPRVNSIGHHHYHKAGHRIKDQAVGTPLRALLTDLHNRLILIGPHQARGILLVQGPRSLRPGQAGLYHHQQTGRQDSHLKETEAALPIGHQDNS